jgi:hypothetical protein
MRVYSGSSETFTRETSSEALDLPQRNSRMTEGLVKPTVKLRTLPYYVFRSKRDAQVLA